LIAGPLLQRASPQLEEKGVEEAEAELFTDDFETLKEAAASRIRSHYHTLRSMFRNVRPLLAKRILWKLI
jgi:hypothetical protein